MKRLAIVATLAAAFAGTTTAAAAAAEPTTVKPAVLHAVDLGTLRGRCCSQAQAINASGVVVGLSAAVGGNHAFVWTNGHMTDLGTLGGANSSATAINDSGTIAGYSETSGGDTHAVIWQNGQITDLGTLGGATSDAVGINNNGAVVGSAAEADGTVVGFVWRNGVMSKLAAPAGTTLFPAAINDNGQVAVTRRTDTDQPGRWFGGSTTLCTSFFGHGNGINIHGDVAGDFVNGPQQAFVFHNQTFIPLPTPAGASLAGAFGVNASRVAVGMYITTANVTKPVRWPAFGAPTTLPGLSGGTNGTGIAYAINGAGTMVGWSSLSAAGGNYHAVLWTS